MNVIFTTQYKDYKGCKVIIEMISGMWVWTANNADGSNIEISDHKFLTAEQALDDSREFIDTIKEKELGMTPEEKEIIHDTIAKTGS